MGLLWPRLGALAACLSAVAGTVAAEPHSIFGSIGCSYGVVRRGCDTNYDEATTATRIDETTIRIASNGNGRTKADAVFQFAMRKAAEATIAAGYDVFEIVQTSDTTRQVSGVSGGGSNGAGGTNPVYSYTSVRPGVVFLIKITKGPRAASQSGQIFDAREVLRFAAAPQ